MEEDNQLDHVHMVVGNINPSDEDICKQDFKRDPSTWRQRFYDRYPTYSNAAELADRMEAYFDGLPKWKTERHFQPSQDIEITSVLAAKKRPPNPSRFTFEKVNEAPHGS